VVIIVPFAIGVWYSFTDWNIITASPQNFVGLDNFRIVMDDVTFIHSFLITTAFAVLSVITVNIAAFFMATLVTRKLKLTNMYRAGFFLPNLIGGIILGYIWFFVFNRALIGLGEAMNIGFLQQSLLLNRWTALFSLVIVGTWRSAGYIMMIYVAAI